MQKYQASLRWGLPLLVAVLTVAVLGARTGHSQDVHSTLSGQGGFAATAFQVNLAITMSSGVGSLTTTATIPAGRRFVIERVGLVGTQPANQAVFYRLIPQINGTQSIFPLTGVFLGNNTASTQQVGFNQEQDGLYCDSTLRFQVTRPTTAGPVNVIMAASGHLEP